MHVISGAFHRFSVLYAVQIHSYNVVQCMCNKCTLHIVILIVHCTMHVAWQFSCTRQAAENHICTFVPQLILLHLITFCYIWSHFVTLDHILIHLITIYYIWSHLVTIDHNLLQLITIYYNWSQFVTFDHILLHLIAFSTTSHKLKHKAGAVCS